MGLLSLFALALASSYVFPQVPAHIRSDPISYQEWLSPIQARFKNWAPLLEAVGIFDIHNTSWFRILLAVIAFIVLVSLGNQIGWLHQATTVKQPDSFYHAPNVTAISGKSSAAQTIDQVRQAMSTLLGHIQQRVDDESAYLYGRHGTWAAPSATVIYLGLMLITCGVAVNGRWGWQQSDVQLLPNKAVFAGPEAAYKIQLTSVKAATGKATLLVGDRQRIAIEQGGRVSSRGFHYQLTDKGGPLVQVSAQRADGETLTLHDYTVRPKPVESLQFAFSPAIPQEEADRLFIVSDEKVVGRLKWLNRDTMEENENPRFHLWIFRKGGQALVGEADLVAEGNAATTTIDNITYNLAISRYVVLNIDYQPGLWVSGIGGVLFIIGLLGSLIPRQQMWSMVGTKAGRVVVRIRDRVGGLSYGFLKRRETVLTDLRTRIEEA